jgi:hypothetical protein
MYEFSEHHELPEQYTAGFAETGDVEIGEGLGGTDAYSQASIGDIQYEGDTSCIGEGDMAIAPAAAELEAAGTYEAAAPPANVQQTDEPVAGTVDADAGDTGPREPAAAPPRGAESDNAGPELPDEAREPVAAAPMPSGEAEALPAPPDTAVSAPADAELQAETADMAAEAETPTVPETPQPLAPLEERLPFYEPHDGTQAPVSEPEKRAVADAFDAFVDTVQLNHAESVDSEHPRSPVQQDILRFRIPVGDRSHWHGEVSVNTNTTPSPFPPERVAAKKVDLSFYVDGRERDFVSYRLCGDGVVRRHQTEDQVLRHERLDQLDSAAGVRPPGSIDDIMAMLSQRAIDASRGSLTMTGLGMQNQPVSMRETDGLIDYLNAAPLVIVPPYREH